MSFTDPDRFASRFGVVVREGALRQGLRDGLEGNRWQAFPWRSAIDLAPVPPPAVGVAIATRTRRPFLVECVCSVISQKDLTWELIVVDDASTDGTAGWLRSQDKDGVSHRRMDQHKERCAARNLGLAEAKGRYVMLLDDDDVLHPGALRLLAQALDDHREAVGARRVWFTAEN